MKISTICLHIIAGLLLLFGFCLSIAVAYHNFDFNFDISDIVRFEPSFSLNIYFATFLYFIFAIFVEVIAFKLGKGKLWAWIMALCIFLIVIWFHMAKIRGDITEIRGAILVASMGIIGLLGLLDPKLLRLVGIIKSKTINQPN